MQTGEKTKKPVPELLKAVKRFEDAGEATEPVSIQNVFIPSWYNKPEDVKPVLKLLDTPILTHQNTSMVIALPGLGKSSICESICASFLNPNVDCLGFAVDPDCQGVIYIDNERTNADVWNSFKRMCKRANIVDGAAVNNVVIAGLRSVPRLSERLATIEALLQANKCSLLLIDGLGDLVGDSNDNLEAIECRIWLREVTVKYNVSILVTIHPNPNSNKPRGHIGSEGHREAECVLLAKIAEGETRILTTDFEHGKNRNSSHVTAAFRWSDDHKMFISADPDQLSTTKPTNGRKRMQAENLMLKVLAPPSAKTHTELIEAIMDVENVTESTAKRRIKDMVDYELIKNHSDALYRANIL